MNAYQPNPYEAEARSWAIRQTDGKARGLADAIESLYATFDEVRAEAGRYGDQCAFTRETLGQVNADLRETFRQANALWARGYAAGDNS